MKTRKLFLVLALVVALLVGTVLVANAADKIKLTGGVNNDFFGMWWEWMDFNVTLDPAAPPTDNADGKVRYRADDYAYDPKMLESWVGEPVCGRFGDLYGVPTIVLVIQVTEVKNIDPIWVDKYMKVSVSDGGQNASEDTIGIVAFDYDNMVPLVDRPSCDFDFENPPEFLIYPSQNGNLTIHD